MPILLNGGTTWMLTKCIEKMLHENHTRMLHGVLKQHPSKQLGADTRCHLEDLPGTMDNREGWWESQGILCCQHNLIIMMMMMMMTFLKSIYLKVNAVAWLEFKLAFFDAVNQNISLYTMETSPGYIICVH